MSEKTIYQRVNEVKKRIRAVGFDQQVTMPGQAPYGAVSYDAVVGLLHDELAAQGIIVVPNLESSETEEGQTAKGGRKVIYRARYVVMFVNADNGDDHFTCRVEAHAEDSTDKAPGKALSYATKGALLKVFNLKSGENDEIVDRDPITLTHGLVLAEAVEMGFPPEYFKEVAAKGGKVDSYEALSMEMITWLHNNLADYTAKKRAELINGLNKAIESWQIDPQKIHDYLAEEYEDGDLGALSLTQAWEFGQELRRWKEAMGESNEIATPGESTDFEAATAWKERKKEALRLLNEQGLTMAQLQTYDASLPGQPNHLKESQEAQFYQALDQAMIEREARGQENLAGIPAVDEMNS